MPDTRLILERVAKTYGARRVLNNVGLDASGGEIIAIVGQNGSGKSTLLKVIAGLLRPTRGSVSLTIGGADASDSSLRRRAVGYVAPDVALYPELTGRENLSFFAAVRGLTGLSVAIDDALTTVGLGVRGDSPLSEYSSGMRQRLRLALSTLFSPAVLLLDEPGLALDASGVALVTSAVQSARARGALVLLATNDDREAALGDRTLALTGGVAVP